MKSKYLFSVSLLALFLTGCGNSSEPSVTPQEGVSKKDGISKKDNTPKKEVKTIVGYVIDSPIWGLEYQCKGQKSKTTDKFGAFECESLPVTFKVGDLVVGHVSTMPKDKKVYPQDIIGVSRDKVEDSDVVELTRFLQTLDNDGNIDEVIKIESSLAKEFVFKKEVDFATLKKSEIASIVQEKIGTNLVTKEEAQKHLRKNLVEGKKPTAIEVSLDMSDIPKGLNGKAVIHGIYEIADGEVKSIISKDVVFDSSDKTIATIDSSGKITALKEGLVEISAKYGTFTAKSDLRVTHTTLTKIEISKPTMAQLTNLALGKSAKFRVKGFYSADGIEKDVTSQIIWSSKSPLLSYISSISNGYSYSSIEASGTGEASLLATLFDLTDEVEFDIQKSDIKRIGIDIKNVKVPLGKSFYIGSLLLGYYEDDSNVTLDTNVTFSVDNENILEERYDTLRAKEKGEVTLTAKYKNWEDSIKLTVVDPVVKYISLSFENHNLYIGNTTHVRVIGTYTNNVEKDITDKVILKNLNPKIISLTPDGNITALKEGYASISATYVEDDLNITLDHHLKQGIRVEKPYVAPVPVSIAINSGKSDEIFLGTSKRVTLAITYDRSDTKNDSMITGVEYLYPKGSTDVISNSYQDKNGVYWEVNDSKIAGFDLSYGDFYLKALKIGEVTITAKLGDLTTSKVLKVVGPTSLDISMEDSDELKLNSSKNLTLKAVYSDGSKSTVPRDDVYWEIGDSSMARLNVNYETTLRGIKKGEVTVIAKFGNLETSKTIKVVGPTSLSISSGDSKEIPFGSSKRLSLQAIYSDGSKQSVNNDDIYWEVDNSNIGKLSVNYGATLQAIKKGKVTVTAKYNDLETSETFKVVDPIFRSIQIEPYYSSTIFIGKTKQFKLIATYSDDSRKDINESVTWKMMSNIATVTDNGKVTGVLEGETRLKATYKDKSTFTNIHVKNVKLTSLVAVGGSSRRLDINDTSKLEVKGLYTDGTEKEITENITWESEDESIVTVDNNGTITAKEYGSTIVSAMINHVNSAKFYIFVDKY